MAYLGNAPAEKYISFERQVFTIVNSQTAYTLSHSVTNENDIRLVVNNVVQEPGSGKAYTASGTTLTLSAALTNGTDEMYCVFLGRAVGTVNAPAGSVGTSQLTDLNVTSGKIANDAVTLAKMASGTDGNIISYDASGNPVAVATGSAGQVLTSAGAGAPPTFATAASGNVITEADTFGHSSNQSISAGANTVISGFNRDNEATFSKIGTGLSESSGVFTFGATGIYWVAASFYIQINGDLNYGSLKIAGTTDNSNYVNMAYNDQSIKQVSGQTYACNYLSAIFDCQNTSTHKVRLEVYGTQAFIILGGANDRHTYLTTMRIGDT